MHVGEDPHTREGSEFRPVESPNPINERDREDGKIPGCWVERGYDPSVEHRPLAGQHLPRWEAIGPPGIRADDGVVGHHGEG